VKDVIVASVEKKLEEHLNRQCLGSLMMQSMTVKAAIDEITANQGCFVLGPKNTAFDESVRVIHTMISGLNATANWLSIMTAPVNLTSGFPKATRRNSLPSLKFGDMDSYKDLNSSKGLNASTRDFQIPISRHTSLSFQVGGGGSSRNIGSGGGIDIHRVSQKQAAVHPAFQPKVSQAKIHPVSAVMADMDELV
jgi:hypothetical protein